MLGLGGLYACLICRVFHWPVPDSPTPSTLRPPPTEEELTPTMAAARRLAQTLAQSRGFDAERILSLVRRLLREPKAQDLGLGIAADISERLVSRVIRGLFQLPPETGVGSYANASTGAGTAASSSSSSSTSASASASASAA